VALKRFALLAAIAALVPACAPVSQMPQIANAAVSAESETMRRLVVEQHLADVERLHRIVYPILAANASLCDTRVAHASGFVVESRFDQSFDYRAASEAAGLDERLSVVAVAPNSPAAKAGMMRGDRLIAVNGASLAPTYRARDEMATKLVDAGSSVTLTLEQGGERRDVTVAREPICDMQSRVMVTEIVNAYATGSELVATTGLLRFLSNDAELAVIVGHEIAHNIQHHAGTGAGNPRIASLLDFFNSVWSAKPKEGSGVPTPISQAYEAEADYVGLYLIARAGFSTASAQNVYRRFAISTPSSIIARQDSSHPASPARVVLLGEAAREIEAKRAAGLQLIPEKK
jgi:membrane-associated protease RseP (regulator of RpoE activity)